MTAPVLLLTRPEAASRRFADECGGLGLHIVIAPLQRIEPVAHDPEVLASAEGLVFTSPVAVPFAGAGRGRTAICVGTGTAAQTGGYGLQGIGSAGYAGAHYILGAHIVADGTRGWNFGAGFRPIGTSEIPFSGSLDGANHAITGLAQTIFEGEGGVFGVTGGAAIANLRLLDIDLRSDNAFSPTVGGLVGRSIAADSPNVIENVLVTGSVTAEMGEVIGSTFGK